MSYFGIYKVNSSYLLTYVRRIRGIAEGDSEVFFFSFFFLQITAVPSTAIPMPITVAKIISDVSPAMQRNPDKNVQ